MVIFIKRQKYKWTYILYRFDSFIFIAISMFDHVASLCTTIMLPLNRRIFFGFANHSVC